MNSELMKQVAENCKKARLENNMTLRDMSEMSEFSVGAISMVENAQRKLPLELAVCYLQIGADLSAIGL